MSGNCSSSTSTTSGFVDLATYDELDKYSYGGQQAVTYFVREVKKATWFTQVPVILSKKIGTAEFGSTWHAQVSRSGDYMTHNWLRFLLPAVTLSPTNQFGADGRLRWTRNVAHNLLIEACMSFNDLTSVKFDNYHLDFWTAFTVPAGKRNGYNNMIGNIDELTNPLIAGGNGINLPSHVCNLPLPFHHTRDSGVALPTAALPYNEITIAMSFRNWDRLLVLDNITTGVSTCPTISDLVSAPTLTSNGGPQIWANYVVVSNDERKRMGRAPRDIMIEQFQTTSARDITASSITAGGNHSFDIRFAHAIKVLFFGIRNRTNDCDWSNYTAASPVPGRVNVGNPSGFAVDFNPSLAADPVDNVTLTYESTKRLDGVPSDYFSLINPFFHAPVIPLETGYHMYSYSLDFFSLDPMGSTNYGKLTNVSICLGFSAAIVAAAASTGTLAAPDATLVNQGAGLAQRYTSFVLAVNNNVVRISGGALGFPVL